MRTIDEIPEMRRQLRKQAASIGNIVLKLQEHDDGSYDCRRLMDYWTETAETLGSIANFPVPGESPASNRQRFVAAVARRSPLAGSMLFPYGSSALNHTAELLNETARYLAGGRQDTDRFLEMAANSMIAKELIERHAKDYVSLVCTAYSAQRANERAQRVSPLSHVH